MDFNKNKMENKFYVPQIEEFHIGFGYEYHEHFGKEFGKWNKYTIESASKLLQVCDLLASGSIRVKLLDIEDIQELGWEYHKEDKNFSNWKTYKRNDKFLTFNTEDITKIEIHNGEWYEDRNTYFEGTIKNYNELQIIMQMLNIE